MSDFLNFLSDYYILFMIISVVILFALVGFIVGERKKNKKGIQTASATDQPINTSTPIENDNTPSVSIAPQTPVMMQETPVQVQTPESTSQSVPSLVIDEPLVENTPVQETVVPLTSNVQVEAPMPEVQVQTPENSVQSVPSLVIDEPLVENTPVQETVVPLTPEVQVEAPMPQVQVQTPENSVQSVPSFVIDEPLVENTPVQETVVPLTPEVQVEAPMPQVQVQTPVVENNTNLEQTAVIPNIDMSANSSIFESNQNN